MIFINYRVHVFMQGHTIEAILKKENKHCVTKEELQSLLSEFYRINGQIVPRVGQSAKIPIFSKNAKL